MKKYLSELVTALKLDFKSLVQILSVIVCVLPFVKLNDVTTRRPLSAAEIEDELKNDYIIPDVIFAVPKHRMEVQFENEGITYDVEYGTKLTPKQTRHTPKVTWPAEKKHLYTLMCLCPDVPSREDPLLKHWVHWLVVNIHGNNVSSGEHINPYHGPGPNEQSGQHRYVFLSYQQDPHTEIHLNRSDYSVDM